MLSEQSTAKENSKISKFNKLLYPFLKNKLQLLDLITESYKKHIIDEDSHNMIKGVFEVSAMQVRDIMVPKPYMVILHHNWTPEKFLPKIISSAHSRFPIVNEESGEVLGILLAKDLLRLDYDKIANLKEIEHLLYPPNLVPESKRLDILLREFQLNYNHMAIVIDEYGHVSGLVTMEDILEQIVGQISDEHDAGKNKELIKPLNDEHYLVHALTPINQFNHYFISDLDDKEFDTIGGLLAKHFGHCPKRGETIKLDNFNFQILHADQRRIRLTKVHKLA